jgi:chorismate mutase
VILSKLGQEVIQYYLHWIETCLEAASDSDTYGETVTADVAALLNIFERITLGKYVAEAKFTKKPEPILETQGEADRLRPLLVHAEREAEVLDHAEQLARHYDFAPDQARGFSEWMIDMTVECQVRYLQKRIRETL